MNNLAQLMRRCLMFRGITFCGTDEALLACTSVNASIARSEALSQLSTPY